MKVLLISIITLCNLVSIISNTDAQNRPVSGGLGLSDVEWKERFGEPTPFDRDAWVYKNGRYFTRSWAGVRGDDNYYVKYIEIVWGRRNAVGLNKARAELKSFFPKDAVRTAGFSRREAEASEYFSSAFLARRILPQMAGSRDCITPWGFAAGGFVVRYYFANGRVARAAIDIGEPHETELGVCRSDS